ncbi:MAG: prepilin-type N-terminal cleavage/methylation domain-containing protein [Planctomycetota bacterium]
MTVKHPQTAPKRSGHSAAFTLIELLVVISIIALLIGILLPVLGAARDSAKTSLCLNHQRQMGIAYEMYATENDDLYPRPLQGGATNGGTDAQRKSSLWFNALDTYLATDVIQQTGGTGAADRNYEVYKQDPVYEEFGEDTGTTGGNGSRTYKMNENFNITSTSGGPVLFINRISLINTTDTVVLFDGLSRDLGMTINAAANTTFSGSEGYVYLRHNNGANVLFADSHAETESLESFTADTSALPFMSESFTYQRWYDEGNDEMPLIWDVTP